MQNGGGYAELGTKIINDALHGFIEIEGRCLQILDTPEFQRLRHIRQLQACHYVFPCAQHTRLEHSLGVFHLSGQVLARLQRKQPELHITPEETELVQMAGLCHDLGHGCFSHLLDYELFPRVIPDFDWVHEKRSCELVNYLVDRNNIDLDKSACKTVESFILGDKSKVGPDFSGDGRGFLWGIVANKPHGIDVDKFDYLARDSRECNIRIAFDHVRVIELMRVVGDEICFDSRGVESVYDLFHSRSKMYSNAYFHKTTRAIERMIADALSAARPVFKLEDCYDNLEKFCKLDDTILREIYRSDDPRLAESREIIGRIENRDLYKFVDEFVVPLEYVEGFKEIRADDIIMYRTSEELKESDIIVEKLQIDYGQGSRNPVDEVGFFDERELRPKKIHISRDRVSTLIPNSYKDITVRLYIKRQDRDLEALAREAFTSFQKDRFGREVMRTPSLKRARRHLENGDVDDDGEEFSLSQTTDTARRLPAGSS